MRMLAIHVDYIKWKAKKKSKGFHEELGENRIGEVGDSVVFFVCGEKGDLGKIDLIVREMLDIVSRLKVKRAVLFPFVHLFPREIQDPREAYQTILRIEEKLSSHLEVERVPFGWYKEFEFRNKGHPLSISSRSI